MDGKPDLEYVGFWWRVLASLIDTVLMAIVTLPVLGMVYGTDYWLDSEAIKGPVDFVVTWLLPAVVIIVFWASKGATPGKLAIGARVVDARTGGKPTTGQLVGRYFGYFVSAVPLGLGLIWVGIDGRKQGWHDKLAGTVVVWGKGSKRLGRLRWNKVR